MYRVCYSSHYIKVSDILFRVRFDNEDETTNSFIQIEFTTASYCNTRSRDTWLQYIHRLFKYFTIVLVSLRTYPRIASHYQMSWLLSFS